MKIVKVLPLLVYFAAEQDVPSFGQYHVTTAAYCIFFHVFLGVETPHFAAHDAKPLDFSHLRTSTSQKPQKILVISYT